MPWFRYGNPRCPIGREEGRNSHSGEMLRAYIRDPVKRVFKAVGWFCEYCQHVYTDEELHPHHAVTV